MTRAASAVLALAVCAACHGPSTPAGGRAAAQADPPGRARTIRMDFPAEPDIADVPRMMARAALQRAGYAIEATSYTDNVVAMQALTTDRLDVGSLALPVVLAAAQKGAAVAVIMEASISTRSLVTAPEITTCSGLHHKEVSVPNLVSSQTLAFKRYIATRCPGADVGLVVISGPDNRLAALVARRTAGALLDLMTLTELQRQNGPSYNVLSVFGVDFPDLGGAAVVASRAFLDRYPDTARDIVRVWLQATRAIQDPAVLKAQIEEHLGLAPELAAIAAATYLEKKVWDLNGGLQDGFMQRNIDFSVDMGVIKPGLTPAAVQDTRIVDDVLAEIGRR